MLTGKPLSEGMSFNRQLLSRYNTEFTLSRYLAYFEMKDLISQIEAEVKKYKAEHPDEDSGGRNLSEETEKAEQEASAAASPVTTSPSKKRPLRKGKAAGGGGTTAVGGGGSVPTMTAKGEKLCDEFFTVLRTSFKDVRTFLQSLEQQSTKDVAEMKQLTVSQIRIFESSDPLKAKSGEKNGEEESASGDAEEKPKGEGEANTSGGNSSKATAVLGGYLSKIYMRVRYLAQYRELNLEAFGKIMSKFRERCCGSSLKLQAQVRSADNIINSSQIAKPTFDANRVLNDITTVYAITHKVNFESAAEELALFVRRDLASRRRIVPLTKAAFYSQTVAHNQAQGAFALKVLCGTASKRLTKNICEVLSTQQLHCDVGTFANGEVSVQVNEAVRGDDIYVVQSTVATAKGSHATSIMELSLLIQTLKLASAKRIVAVVPYLGYTRNTISISAVSDIITEMGCDHVITVDLLKDQVEGMFGDIPVENMSPMKEFITYIVKILQSEQHSFMNLSMVAPDGDTVGRARSFADLLMKHAQLDSSKHFVEVATAVKRVGKGEDQLDVVGSVSGRDCFIVDSVIDSGLNVAAVARTLKEKGAKRVVAVATHAIFSGDAVPTLVEAPIDEIIVTDSVSQDKILKNEQMAKKLRILPVAPLLSEAIQKVHYENSLSTLFEKK